MSLMPDQENTIYCQRFRNFSLIVTFASKNIYCPVHQELQAVPDNEPWSHLVHKTQLFHRES